MVEKIQSLRTFRYATSGDRSARVLLYVLHGYGQLAPFFIRKFDFLNDCFIVAPEGMHRFYLSGSSGRVGASWMTREERMDDIQDNCNWLMELHRKLTADHTYDKTIILGFSQGGATAARWHNDPRMKSDHLIMWASVFPPDLSPVNTLKENSGMNLFILGDNDPYFNSDQQKEAKEFYSLLQFKTIDYSGNHDICRETLASSLNLLK